jgi:hypothetical protein
MVNAFCYALLSRELGRVALREFRMDAKPAAGRGWPQSRAPIRKKTRMSGAVFIGCTR